MTPDDMEIIVVDDQSIDDTFERACSVEARMPFKFRVLKGEGRGPAAARNLGWRDAKGAIVLFTDDDCEPAPSWAAEMVGFLGSNSDYAGAGGEIRRLRDSLAARFTDDIRCMDHPGDPADVYYLVSANASYRRDVLESVGGFSEVFPCAGGEDPELSHRVRALGIKLAKIPDALVLHNHPDTLAGVYRMHHRYGRGEYNLWKSGEEGCGTRGDLDRLTMEWRRSIAIYRRRTELPVYDRFRFCLLNMLRCYALFVGFRFQERQGSV
jgi:cellulose synthase/poly-beta-1,6-N-acetylglucosamine synthase-like glycosyltransferase